MGTREQNERKFGNWQDLPSGGRRYWIDITGRHGWSAQYIKEVDDNENTVRFYQEIRDHKGRLVETHWKYPKDTGHKKTKE